MPPMIETAVRDRRTDDHVVVVLKDRGVGAAALPERAPRTPVARRLLVVLRAVARYLADDGASAAIEADHRRRQVETARHLLAIGLLR
ncbi:MAG: hypothetical protein ACTHXO_06235 [Actinomycetaceae bacterium]